MKMMTSSFRAYGTNSPAASVGLLDLQFSTFVKQHNLTRRETQVLRVLMVEGLRNDDIAAKLHISPKTLKNHLSCIMKKTDTYSARSLQAKFMIYMLDKLVLIPPEQPSRDSYP